MDMEAQTHLLRRLAPVYVDHAVCMLLCENQAHQYLYIMRTLSRFGEFFSSSFQTITYAVSEGCSLSSPTSSFSVRYRARPTYHANRALECTRVRRGATQPRPLLTEQVSLLYVVTLERGCAYLDKDRRARLLRLPDRRNVCSLNRASSVPYSLYTPVDMFSV